MNCQGGDSYHSEAGDITEEDETAPISETGDNVGALLLLDKFLPFNYSSPTHLLAHHPRYSLHYGHCPQGQE